jgi:hypothetical protein
MNRNPTGVVGMVHGLEPHRQLCQGIHVHLKRCLAHGPYQNYELQLPDSSPVVELGAGFHLLLTPFIKLQLLMACVTRLITVVVVDMLLQCELCCYSDSMSPPGSTDM